MNINTLLLTFFIIIFPKTNIKILNALIIQILYIFQNLIWKEREIIINYQKQTKRKQNNDK